MRTILIAILTAGLGLCQSVTPPEVDEVRFFAAVSEVTLSGTAGVFTIQAPVGGARRVYLKGASIYCSADCTISQERNGSAASATAVTAVSLNSTATPTAVFYSGSNVGAGAALPKLELKAGQQGSVDLSFSVFSRNSPTIQNHTFRTNSITGTVRLSIFWGEK